jgi:phosphoribosyl-AMP cyclohydrolase
MKLLDSIKFDAAGLVPAIIQNVEDGHALTLCYMDDAALKRTLQTGKVHVFRREKGRVMLKGETSGHIQEVREIFVDCEGNSLLIGVKQHVAACHHGYMSCYYRRYDPETHSFKIAADRIFDPEKVYKDEK